MKRKWLLLYCDKYDLDDEDDFGVSNLFGGVRDEDDVSQDLSNKQITDVTKFSDGTTSRTEGKYRPK
jgi:hypothetical protein